MLTTVVVLLLLIASSSGAVEPFDAVSPSTNVHHSGRHCELCHDPVPDAGGSPNLRFGHDDRSNCRCHFGERAGYPHPIDIEPSRELLDRIPASFPLQDGRLSCSTCHDVAQQCRIRQEGHAFLRGGPYSRAKDMCYRCHDSLHYERRNPHQHLDEDGGIIEETCLFCHVSVPDATADVFADVSFIADVELLCRRCHRTTPYERHPGGVQHHVVPSEKLLSRIRQLEEEHGALMPLTSSGEITCVTCHNPHQLGVIPAFRPSAHGAGAKGRHRIPDICIECHLK